MTLAIYSKLGTSTLVFDTSSPTARSGRKVTVVCTLQAEHGSRGDSRAMNLPGVDETTEQFRGRVISCEVNGVISQSRLDHGITNGRRAESAIVNGVEGEFTIHVPTERNAQIDKTGQMIYGVFKPNV